MYKEKGYVYILTNPSFREDWVKIGKSTRTVDVRSKELDNTAVPLPFEIYATLKTTKYNEVERQIHNQIDLLTKLRIRNNREFFNVKPQTALKILKDISKLLDDAEIEEFFLKDVETKIQGNNIKSSKTNEQHFLSDLDIIGVNAFTTLFNFAKEKFFILRWGVKGFSLNMSINDVFIALCYGYPLNSAYKQNIYTNFEEVQKKIQNSENIISFYQNQLSKMSFFVKTGSNYKWNINNSYNEKDMGLFLKLLEDFQTEIEKIIY